MKKQIAAILVAVALSAGFVKAQEQACEQQREYALQAADEKYKTCVSNFDWYDSVWNFFFGGNSCEQQHSIDINAALDAFRNCLGS